VLGQAARFTSYNACHDQQAV